MKDDEKNGLESDLTITIPSSEEEKKKKQTHEYDPVIENKEDTKPKDKGQEPSVGGSKPSLLGGGAGMAAGLMVGMFLVPVLGPFGPIAGAAIGGLVGSSAPMAFNGIKNKMSGKNKEDISKNDKEVPDKEFKKPLEKEKEKEKEKQVDNPRQKVSVSVNLDMGNLKPDPSPNTPRNSQGISKN